MCKWGTSEPVEVTVPAHLSHTGETRQAVKDVDACIAPLVRALNAAGLTTVASCCGHGKGHGNIALADGREIVIVPDYVTGRQVDRFLKPEMPSEQTVSGGNVREAFERIMGNHQWKGDSVCSCQNCHDVRSVRAALSMVQGPLPGQGA